MTINQNCNAITFARRENREIKPQFAETNKKSNLFYIQYSNTSRVSYYKIQWKNQQSVDYPIVLTHLLHNNCSTHTALIRI